MKETRNVFSSHKTQKMPIRIALHMSLANLNFKKLRTLLTIGGVTIGVGAVFFMASVGLGLRNLVTQEVVGSSSIKTVDVTTSNSRVVQLDQENVNRMKELAHIESVGINYSFAGSIKLESAESDTVVFGIDKAYQDLSNLTVASGEINNPDNKNDIILNTGLLESIGLEDPQSAIGKEVEIIIPESSSALIEKDIKESFSIVGVIDSGTGSEVFMSHYVFQDLGIDTFSQVKLVVDDRDNIESVRSQIESFGLETFSPIDTLDQIEQFFKFFNIAMIGFGSIGMIVAVIGMFNTLTISLIERTQEIGLMIALGARRRDIRKLFSVEAWLMAVVGATIGIFMSIIISFIINIMLNNFAHSRGVTDSFSLFSTPILVIGAVLGFTMLIGLLVVYFPARRAARTSPIDALRHE